MAEAKNRACNLDIEEYARKAKKFVKEKDFSDQANAEMRLYNLTMKVNRLELLKAKIGLEMVGSFDELEKYSGETLTEEAMKELERMAGILGETVTNADTVRQAQDIVNASFHNATYSERIWAHQAMLKNDMERLLSEALIQGKSASELAASLRKRYDVSRYNSVRLLVTEIRRVQTAAAKRLYEDNGNEEYEYLAVGPRPCDECRRLDGKVFKVSKMMPGTNAPPMHPQCHCATAPHTDRAEFERWLDEQEPLGEREASKKKYKYKHTVVDEKMLDSTDYRKRFSKISGNTKVNRSVYIIAREFLNHRSGTKFEDLAYINATSGKYKVNKDYDEESKSKPNRPMNEMLKSSPAYTIIGVHNHPGSNVPSVQDLKVCIERKYKFVIIVCHDGTIYKYMMLNQEKFNEINAEFALDRMSKEGYTKKVRKLFSDIGVYIEVL